MEKNMSFVTALQDLKNLRPQLYSAAEYCEKSYLNSEQKPMVLENLKDYAVRALVNAIDHLGTVAYKLSDVMEQQTLEISSMDLKVTCLNQQLLTCRIYVEKEGLRQQQLLAIIPKHHKHYTLPNSTNKRVHFSPHVKTDSRQPVLARARFYPSGSSAAATLSWHMASETKSSLKGSSRAMISAEDSKPQGRTSTGASVNLLEFDKDTWRPASSMASQTLRFAQQEYLRPFTPFRSFDYPSEKEAVRTPVRSKSVLSAFFVKQKTPKFKTST